MFKLESLITPVILNYVEKYVKNIKPTDAQVSLWEGEVAFQNLDLRLDVLETELNLPFEFLSGHIHEMTIRVPWTKINSEPINIIINTIEFVLKLKEQNAQETSSSANQLTPQSPTNVSNIKRISKAEDSTQNSSYMPGLVNKIINNIQIDCHNIILKYVEEDIVVSMNVQFLSLKSADQNWNPGFIDANFNKCFVRKLIQISDLTICLDKRNSMGVIDCCQEPILYKCSLEMRLVRKCNSNLTSSITKLGISTKSIEMNISSLQFPMVMRLLNLIMALKSGELKSRSELEIISDSNEEAENDNVDVSYLTWAWNLIPSFSFDYGDIDEPHDENLGIFLTIGIYIGQLKITLKSSEFVTDSIVGPSKKIRYKPILRLTLGEIFSETFIANESNWYDSKFGFSKCLIEALGLSECLDGKYVLQNTISESGAYLKDSLFDLETKQHINFNTNIQYYLEKNSRTYLQNRGNFFVADIVQFREKLNDDEESAKNLTRVFFSSVNFKYNTAFVVICEAITDLIDKYDYPPYVETQNNPTFKLSPPLLDDFNELMIEIPMKLYEFFGTNISIELYPKTECNWNKDWKQRKSLKYFKLPYFHVNFESILGKLETPMNQDRLVHTTSQLPEKPIELLTACYNNFEFNYTNIQINLIDSNNSPHNLIRLPKGNVNFSQILQENLWRDDDKIPKIKFSLNLEKNTMNFSNPQLRISNLIVKTIFMYDAELMAKLEKNYLKYEIHADNLPKIILTLSDVSLKFNNFINRKYFYAKINLLEGWIESTKENVWKSNFLLIGKAQTDNQDWLTLSCQIPNDFNDPILLKFIAMKIKEHIFLIDSNLLEFLNYKEIENENRDSLMDTEINYRQPVLERRSSRKSVTSERNSRKVSQPEETIHISSEKDDYVEQKTKKIISKESVSFDYEMLELIKTLSVDIEVLQGSVIFFNDENSPENIKSLNEIDSTAVEHTTVMLPKIICKSAISDDYLKPDNQFFNKQYFRNSREYFPWKCSISEFNVSNKIDNLQHTLLHSVNTNITLALTHKKDLITVPDNTSVSKNDDTHKSPKTTSNDEKRKELKMIKDNIAINLHIDMSPIHIEISESQAKQIQQSIQILLKIIDAFQRNCSNISSTEANNQENVKISTNSEDDPSLKEFLEIDAGSELSENTLLLLPKNINFSIWLQWTVTKFAIDIYDDNLKNSKLVIEMEDLITSFDKHTDYFKIHSKISIFNLRLFELGEKNDWILKDNLKSKMQADNLQSPYLSIIITLAKSDSFFKKVGVQRKTYSNRNLLEIVVIQQATEIFLDLDRLIKFIPVLCQLQIKYEYENEKNNAIKSVENIPLIYYENKGTTIYTFADNKIDWCNVCILKFEEIRLTPIVENPLNRNILRSDVYTKAAQLGILHTPGAIVEDRQYELKFHNISMATASWQEIMNHMKEISSNLHNTNPAFEWNNQIQTENTLELREILSNFIISITYAPCIIYNNILICGESIEFNCVNDLVASFTTDQLNLFSCIYKSIKNLLILLPNETKSGIPKTKSIASYSSKNSFKRAESLISLKSLQLKNKQEVLLEEISDSGISTMEKSRIIKGSTSNESKKIIPYDISLVAGIFVMKFYHKTQERRKSDHSSIANYLTPLICFTLIQPNLLISQKIYENVIQMSVFDFLINLSEDQTDQFSFKLFDTKRGVPSLSGIPPTLVSIKKHLNRIGKSEIEFVIEKPIFFYLSHKSIEKLVNIYIKLYESVSPIMLDTTEVSVTRGNKIFLIKSMVFMADRLNFKLVKVVSKFYRPNEYEIKFVLNDLKFGLNFPHQRPEKLHSVLSVGSCYLQTESKIFLHPVHVGCNLDLIQESWYSLPIIIGNLNLNIVQIDVGVENLRHLLNACQSFQETLVLTNKLMAQLNEQSKHTGNERLSRTNLVNYLLPDPVRSSIKEKIKVEYYQDDLRAGAFQFVETNYDSNLPLPYQIQIIKKNYGIICWRYPQPRKIHKLHINPVPMPVSARIKCKMEYYSEANKNFLDYCEFFLSETEETEVKLPERLITSMIWRVVIVQSIRADNRKYSSSHEEDVELREIKIEEMLDIGNEPSDNVFKLNPKILVGSMRLDTNFDPDFIKKIEFLFSSQMIQINIQNQQNNRQQNQILMPPPLNKFKFSNESDTMNETFLSIIINNFKLYFNVIDFEKFSSTLDLEIHAKCLDYCFLNMLILLENSKISSFVELNNELNINLIIDGIKLNLNPGVVHALLISKSYWDRILFKQEKLYHVLPRFVIVNRTESVFFMGQVDTDEYIRLDSQQCITYSFLSDLYQQAIRFYSIDGAKSEPILIKIPEDENENQYMEIIPDKVYIVETKKLSSTQCLITIKGLVEILSMVTEEFHFQFRYLNSDGTYNVLSQELQLDVMGNLTIDQTIMKDTDISMRLKFSSIISRGWTGEIPLKPNKNLPWLVKVPNNGTSNDDFTSYWIRIVREDISELKTLRGQPQRILIIIWPVFQIKSNFSTPLTALESSTQKIITLDPKGFEVQLQVPATHQTDHKLIFQDNFEFIHEEKQEVVLSLKTIDWNKFFWYDERKWTINSILNEFSDKKELIWPYNNVNEQYITRNIEKNDVTMPLYKFYPSRELSCALTLEISPWCTVINSIRNRIRIRNSATNQIITIESNNISMVFIIENGFTLEIEADDLTWISSMPIYFDKSEIPFRKSESRILSADNTNTEILLKDSVAFYKIILKNVNENGRKILLIEPVFILSNHSNVELKIIPFCLEQKELFDLTDVQDLIKNKLIINIPKRNKRSKFVSQGIPLNCFNDLKSRNNQIMTSAFVFYVVFVIGTESSPPISLMTTFNRISFSIQDGTKSIPFCVSLLEKNGQKFLNIFPDKAPNILFNNRTDLNLYIAQTNFTEGANEDNSNTNNNVETTVIPEYENENFQWFQILKSNSQLFYTPSDVYKNFPDTAGHNISLSVAVVNNDDNNTSISNKSVRWSKAIKINETLKTFFHIPLYGDVKIIICDKHKCIRISIIYIAQKLEFSVKELRSRLLRPSENDNKTLNQQSEQMVFNNEENENEFICCIPKTIFLFSIKIRAFIKELNISISKESKSKISTKTEILAIYIDDVIFKFDEQKRNLWIILSNMQIDNQLYTDGGSYDFPVLLCSQDLYKRSSILPSIYHVEEYTKHYQKTALIKIKTKFFENDFEICKVHCKLNAIRAYIEDTYLSYLFDFLLIECFPNNIIMEIKEDQVREILPPGFVIIPNDIEQQAIYLAEPFQLNIFKIDPMSVMLSVHTCVRMYIALDHSPLEFSTYERENIFTLPLRFGHTLGMHYLSGALFGAGWVVGSLEILGSPSGLARSFSIGLKDFISLPVQGLFRGPNFIWGFVVGVTQGSASLLRNITAGTVNSVTKLAASVARNIDRLTFDEEHFQRTEALRRSRPQGFTEGFAQGLTGLGISILGAVGGFARHTLEARSPAQVVTGMGRGIVGIVTKPISGAAELVALTGQGVLHTVGFNALPMQRERLNSKNSSVLQAECKIFKILPKILQTDQILFYHEATLVTGDQLKRAFICLTSVVLCVLEYDKIELSYVLPVDKINAEMDKNDRTLIYINVDYNPNDKEEEMLAKNFTNQRIMDFLKSSSQTSTENQMSLGSLDSLLNFEKKNPKKNDWSFYISENLGQHLLQYLKIIKSKA